MITEDSKHTVKISVPVGRIADLLSHALESGDVGYWLRIGKVRGNTKRNRERAGYLAKRHDPVVWCPLAGGSVEIIEHNDSGKEEDWSAPLLLDCAAIERGLALMPTRRTSTRTTSETGSRRTTTWSPATCSSSSASLAK